MKTTNKKVSKFECSVDKENKDSDSMMLETKPERKSSGIPSSREATQSSNNCYQTPENQQSPETSSNHPEKAHSDSHSIRHVLSSSSEKAHSNSHSIIHVLSSLSENQQSPEKAHSNSNSIIHVLSSSSENQTPQRFQEKLDQDLKTEIVQKMKTENNTFLKSTFKARQNDHLVIIGTQDSFLYQYSIKKNKIIYNFGKISNGLIQSIIIAYDKKSFFVQVSANKI